MDPFRQARLVDQRRILAYYALEIGNATRGQFAEQVALDDLMLVDEFAIHGLVPDRRCRSSGYGIHGVGARWSIAAMASGDEPADRWRRSGETRSEPGWVAAASALR
ncbi:MAG: hypothetical protein KDI23_06900 [Pseudomonadales bacterium]|nr:hypothetical protein [Pseudomonadales bacterium]